MVYEKREHYLSRKI